MKELQQTQVYQVIAPQAIKDNAAFTSYVVDTKDADYVEFVENIGATDVAAAVERVYEADVASDTYTLTSGTAVLDVTTKISATADNTIRIIGVNCRNARKRYLQLQVTAGDGTSGTYLAVTAHVRRSGVRGSTATERGVGYVEYT